LKKVRENPLRPRHPRSIPRELAMRSCSPGSARILRARCIVSPIYSEKPQLNQIRKNRFNPRCPRSIPAPFGPAGTSRR